MNPSQLGHKEEELIRGRGRTQVEESPKVVSRVAVTAVGVRDKATSDSAARLDLCDRAGCLRRADFRPILCPVPRSRAGECQTSPDVALGPLSRNLDRFSAQFHCLLVPDDAAKE